MDDARFDRRHALSSRKHGRTARSPGVVHIVPCKMVPLVIVGNVCVEMLCMCSICPTLRSRESRRRVPGFSGQDVADHLARRSPSEPAPAPAGKSGVRDLREGLLWQGFNRRKALGQEKCDAWDTAGRLSCSPFTRVVSVSSDDISSAAGRLNGGNVSAAMAAMVARRLNSCSVMALLPEPAQFVTVQPVG